MIFEANANVRKKVAPMFENIDSTIIRSYLEGHMGTAFVNDLENPTVAQIIVGIFVFYGGDPHTEEAKILLTNLPEFALVIVESDEWKELIESVHSSEVDKFKRYRFEKNPEHLDRTHLHNLMSTLPQGYEVKKIDNEIVNLSSFHELSEDFVSQFDSLDDFLNRGVGYAILHNGEVVSAATSFSIYNEGIEIEIATHTQFRRKGLASIVASTLIIDCLDSGRYPSWDAANSESVHLAKRLGYIFKESYDTYFIEHMK